MGLHLVIPRVGIAIYLSKGRYDETFAGEDVGFNSFGTRLQSLWIIFFFARKNFPCGVSNRMQDKILFRQL